MRSGIHRFLADLNRDAAPVFRVHPGTPVDITSRIPGVPSSMKLWPPDYMQLSRSFAIPARVDPFGRYIVPQLHLFLALDHQLWLMELARSDILKVELCCWVVSPRAEPDPLVPATDAIIATLSCCVP